MTFGDIFGPETESCGCDDTVQGLSQRGMFPFERVCIHFRWLAKDVIEFISNASVRYERLGKFEPRPPCRAIYEATMRVSNYRSNVRASNVFCRIIFLDVKRFFSKKVFRGQSRSTTFMRVGYGSFGKGLDVVDVGMPKNKVCEIYCRYAWNLFLLIQSFRTPIWYM